MFQTDHFTTTQESKYYLHVSEEHINIISVFQRDTFGLRLNKGLAANVKGELNSSLSNPKSHMLLTTRGGWVWWSLAYTPPRQIDLCSGLIQKLEDLSIERVTLLFSLDSALIFILKRISQIPWIFVKLDFLDKKKGSWLGITLSGPLPLKMQRALHFGTSSEAEDSVGIVAAPPCAGAHDRALWRLGTASAPDGSGGALLRDWQGFSLLTF